MRYVASALALILAVYLGFRCFAWRSEIARMTAAPPLSATSPVGSTVRAEGALTSTNAGFVAYTNFARSSKSRSWYKLNSELPPLTLTSEMGSLQISGDYALIVPDPPAYGYDLLGQSGVRNGNHVCAIGTVQSADAASRTFGVKADYVGKGSLDDLTADRRWNSWLALGEALLALAGAGAALFVPQIRRSASGWAGSLVRALLDRS